MTNQNYLHVEFDSIGIVLVSNDNMTGSAAATVLREDTGNVIRVVRLASPRQNSHPVDRSDAAVSGDIQQFRVDVKPGTNIRVYAAQLVKSLEKKLRCTVELKPKI
jgi:hypothetical protein